MASIYLPPIARKKKVDGYPRHDTSRVFADLQVNHSPGQTSYGAHYIGHAILSPRQNKISVPNNKPHPAKVTFLRQNPRFICEPICYVKTTVDSPVTYPSWWPEELPEKSTSIPQKSFDSTARSDYRPPPLFHERVTRYSSNLALQLVPAGASGILPQAADKTGPTTPKVVEKISYEHQFNSRLDPSQPIRGRRHGSFIWKVVSDIGKKNRKGSKPVEYAYVEDELAHTGAAQSTTENVENGEKAVEVNEPGGTPPPSDEN
ncbi:uncharacterized protein C2orf73 homolog [Stylophora pistillata]|uniref:Uncharacterized protein C2orf73-like n=1 Tax=Stylophora pistillata TaxID=50429 RepID=A0A2B4SAB9_STYPI|nr:uncharacterized protein C2orf73 homolog [Stylophora pistillata]PFX25518.1 Uncharacterized protein C2orf73-like [Stylophora pistillata]